MNRKTAVRRLYQHAAYERENSCPTCGQQKQHFCGMGACVDLCPACTWGAPGKIVAEVSGEWQKVIEDLLDALKPFANSPYYAVSDLSCYEKAYAAATRARAMLAASTQTDQKKEPPSRET